MKWGKFPVLMLIVAIMEMKWMMAVITLYYYYETANLPCLNRKTKAERKLFFSDRKDSAPSIHFMRHAFYF